MQDNPIIDAEHGFDLVATHGGYDLRCVFHAVSMRKKRSCASIFFACVALGYVANCLQRNATGVNEMTLVELMLASDVILDVSDDYAGEFGSCILYFTADDEDAPVELIGWSLGGLPLTRAQLEIALTPSQVSSFEVIAAEKWDAESETRELNRGDDANDWNAE